MRLPMHHQSLASRSTFKKSSTGNEGRLCRMRPTAMMMKSRAFHNVGAAYTKDLSKNELADVLLIGGTHNKQGSKDDSQQR